MNATKFRLARTGALLLAAAALQYAIDPGASAWAELPSRGSPDEPPPFTRADYHTIAARYLPDLIDLTRHI